MYLVLFSRASTRALARASKFNFSFKTLSTRLKETEEVKTKLEIELRVTRCTPIVIFPPFLPHYHTCSRRFNLERDVADARAQVAATLEAEKQSIERAKAADKKLDEAKIVVSASKQETGALQTKIKNLTAELSAAKAQLQQAVAALAEETHLRRLSSDELEALRLQVASGTTSLQEQLQCVDSARAQSQARAEEFRGAAQALQEEVKEARAAAAAQQTLLEMKLAETKAALASEATDLKQRLAASENLCSVHQQQHQQECARQERERKFVEQKLAKLEEQQLAAAASESAAAATQAAAERMTATASERIAAVSAVFKKMANLDEGLEGDCTCLQCMQALADPVLLQVMRRCVACHCF